jgi:Holliday junction resolvase RusA-like endonuclease
MFELKMLERDTPFPVAVAVTIHFWLRRPKSVTRQYATGTYDIDKLTRAVLDSLESAGVIVNDNLVVDLTVRKTYADDHEPGMQVTVVPYDNDFIIQGVSDLERKRRGLV